MLSPVCRNCGAQWGRIAGSLDPIPEVAMGKKKARTRRNKRSTIRMKNPPHPGDLIRTEVIESLNLSLTKAASLLKVRRSELSDLLHGKIALTRKMAMSIEKVFGPDMGHLLRMQFEYDRTNDDDPA
jgi:addiction module HigA family antidote